jgi:hypothetical protein
MKLVYRASTLEGANEIKTLLDNSGIPATISNTAFASLNLSFIPNSLGIFIYSAAQYSDALALIHNKDHIVRNPVDTDAFYESLNNEQSKKAAYNAMNRFILGLIVFGLVCSLLIYALSS